MLAGLTELMSPVRVAVITVLFAFVMVTTEKVFGLPFFGNDSDEGADKTHGGGVGEDAGEACGDDDGDEPGEGLGSSVGSGDGSVFGLGDGSPSGEGDGEVSSEGLGLAEGSVPSPGLGAGELKSSVGGSELSVIPPTSLSWKIPLPIVTSPEPETFIELGSQQSLFNSNPI